VTGLGRAAERIVQHASIRTFSPRNDAASRENAVVTWLQELRAQHEEMRAGIRADFAEFRHEIRHEIQIIVQAAELRLIDRIHATEMELGARITETETRLADRISKVAARVSAVRRSLSAGVAQCRRK
jgi:hypothetical protein